MFSRAVSEDSSGQLPCGVGSAMMIGVGAIVGGGVFATMGPALLQAGGAAPWAYALGAVPAFLTAYSYSRLTVRFPGCGGTAGFFNVAFGSGYVSAGLNLMLIICYACIASLFVGIFGAYLASLLGIHGEALIVWSRVFCWLGVGFVAYINLFRIEWIKRLQPGMNAVKLLVMGVFVLGAFYSPIWNSSNFSVENWMPISSICAGSMMVFVSYEGFELIASSKRPFAKPERTVPLAYVLCLVIVLFYYVLIAVATLGNASLPISSSESSCIISVVAERFMGTGGAVLLNVGAVVSAISALNADVFSVSDMPVLMAREREMPSWFAREDSGRNPWGVVFVCGLLLLFINLLSMDELVAVSSMGFLFIYAIVNGISLGRTERTPASWCFSGGAILFCLAAVAILILQICQSPRAVLVLGTTGGMLFLPFVWQAAFFSVRFFLKRGE